MESNRFSCACGIAIEWVTKHNKAMVWGTKPMALLAMINFHDGTYRIYEQALRGLNDNQRAVLNKYLDELRFQETRE